jgi:hypothetical protein
MDSHINMVNIIWGISLLAIADAGYLLPLDYNPPPIAKSGELSKMRTTNPKGVFDEQ